MKSVANREIDELVGRFFAAFTTEQALRDGLGILRELFIAEALIVKLGDQGPEMYKLEQFIAPRAVLLASGKLRDFVEQELSEQTQIFGRIAQRRSLYRKSGLLAGKAFETRGVKLLQLVRTEQGWRLSSLSWQDDL